MKTDEPIGYDGPMSKRDRISFAAFMALVVGAPVAAMLYQAWT